jgi:hypothetical protein
MMMMTENAISLSVRSPLPGAENFGQREVPYARGQFK